MMCGVLRKNEICVWKLENIASLFTELKGMIGPVATMVCNLAIESNNLWTNTLKTEPIPDVDEEQKDRFLEHLGYALGRKRKRMEVTCMVSNVTSHLDSDVVMAHIAPKRSKIRIWGSIGMKQSDVQDIRNCLLLAKEIEKAFNELQLSFMKTHPLHDRLYLKIWDNSIRDTPIFDDATMTIGECEGARLKLGEIPTDLYKHNPFRRALSYQAYLAYLKYKHLHPEEPIPCETEYVKQRSLMKNAVIAAIEEELTES